MTQPVDFTADAIKDLSGIASYTAEAWGHEKKEWGQKKE